MKLRDLLNMEIDADVYDDFADDLGIAIAGPIQLTAEGKKRWSEILDLEVEIEIRNIVHVAIAPGHNGSEQISLHNSLSDLLSTASGCCTFDKYT